MLRSILAVVGGYVTLIIGVSAFFAIVTFVAPAVLEATGEPSFWLLLAELGASLIVAFIAGYVTGWIAPRRPVLHGAVLAGLMVVLGLVSTIAETGLKPLWSSLAVALVPPILVVLGAQVRARVEGV
ncbi:MAG: hypothetical protein AAGA48_15095 [Myxococcota bacterium]